MVHIASRTMLPLPFGRRGRRWRTHDGSIHRADHDIFCERCHLFRNGNVRQHAHRADYLAQGEEEYERNGLHIHSSWHH
jgi:hypothetical protein